MRNYLSFLYSIFAAIWLCVGLVSAQQAGDSIPPEKIDKLRAALSAELSADKHESSAARKRLAVKRVIRDGSDLFEANLAAPNRYEILSVLFRAQQQLFALEDSPRNREALLETCRQLTTAPDTYAHLRLDAELLLSQTEIARQGATQKARAAALMPLVDRYRNTSADGKMLQVAMVMALELGDTRLIAQLREEMAERFAGDLEMIQFQQEKLGGQVFGAPFCGTFQRSDGTAALYPADGLGRTELLYFWSQQEGENEDLKELAAKWNERKVELAGRLSIVSLNVDELPDAGEKVLRELGVDWPALHLPGGRKNPIYQTFAKGDPALLTLSPTGYAALVMAGATRKLSGTTEVRDYDRWFNSALAREWTHPSYVNQLTSLLVGDFLVVDVEGPFEPTLPPELKSVSPIRTNNPTRLKPTANSVPDSTLQAIQDCFTLPPNRYRMSVDEIRSAYATAEQRCAQAIASHPGAPNLWIVRNRRIVAQLGLWKLTTDRAHYQIAIEESQAALESDMPPGAEVVAQFCLAKESLRDQGTEPKKVIEDFVEALGGAKAAGPTFAAASLLALDVGRRELHEKYRDIILKDHFENPMMWTFTSALLDRYHRYWLYRVPFTAGWSYGRQQKWSLSRGNPDEVERRFQAELETLDGKPYRLPEDGLGKWTVVLFGSNYEDPKTSPVGMASRYLIPYGAKRGLDDFQVVLAVMADDLDPVRAALKEKPNDCQTVVVPGGVAHPLVRQLGMLEENERPNALVLRPDGTLATFLSGLTLSRAGPEVILNIVDWHDEQVVASLLDSGAIGKAQEFIFKLAPPFDPEAVDEKGRKLKKPEFSVSHVRARARVYIALQDWKAALGDAEELVKRLTETGGSMSLRPEELDEAEELRDLILTKH